MLDILLDLGDSMPLVGGKHFRPYELYRKALGAPDLPMWRLNRALHYLEQRKQIKIVQKRNKKFIKLTSKGKLKALMNRLETGFRKDVKWDGKFRLIIWDIPELTRKQRDHLRLFVKSLGFYMLQQSVFITPYPLPASAVEYLQESKLLPYIRFLRVDKVDNDKLLRKHFALGKT